MGSSMIPANNSAGTANLTIKLSQTNFDNFTGATTLTNFDVYTTLSIDKSTTFGNGSNTLLIPVTVTGPCIVSGRTYEFYEGGPTGKLNDEMKVASGNSVTGDIKVAINPFPAGVTVDVTVSH